MDAKVVLFDFGGTLDADGVPWPQRFFPIYGEVGVATDWESFLKAFYRSDDELARRHRLPGLTLRQTVELQAAGVLEILAPQRLGSAGEIARRFAAEARSQFAANRPVLEALRSRFKLGVVSNFYGNLDGILAAEGWAPLFDVAADSGALGYAKPDPAIFRYALQRLGASAAEAIMVGDSLPRDIRAAEALGMRHLWLDPAGGPACCPRGAKIRRLAELAERLRVQPCLP